MLRLKLFLTFLNTALTKLKLYLLKIWKRIFTFLSKHIFEKRKRILGLFLGVMLFLLVHFARLGKHVVKQSDTIAKEAIERIDDVAFENMKLGIETVDTYSKANSIFGTKDKVNRTKSKDILNRLKECYNLNQHKNKSYAIDSCNAIVFEYYKKINDREALQEMSRPFIKYYLHDLTILKSILSKVMKSKSDAEFHKIWNEDIKKMKYKEENFYGYFYTQFKEKKQARDSLLAKRDSLLKRKENRKDNL